MNGCSRLKCLPSRIEMESLETLILSRCRGLERFPEVSPCMVKLSQINLYSCSGIKELPSSIRYLSSLGYLNLTNCDNLRSIPNSICELKHLKSLHLHNCKKLNDLPRNLGSMKLLEELRLGFEGGLTGRPLESVDFHSFRSLSSLKKLDLSWRKIEEESFPKDLDVLSALEELYLSGNCMLVQLPASICRLSSLKRLELNECSRLRSLCGIPSTVQVLKANKCISLEKIGDLSEDGKWLFKIWLLQCQNMLRDEESKKHLDKLSQLSFIKKCAAANHRLTVIVPGSKIPSWFQEEKRGCRIALKLPQKWQTQVTGFAFCAVFHGEWWAAIPRVVFRIVSDGKVIIQSEVDFMRNANKTSEKATLWISYMPLGFFQQMYHDLHPEDWSHIEGNIDMTLTITSGQQSARCGAHVIYKRDVESLQQTSTSIADYGSMMHIDDEDLGYDEFISGNTYVYEEKSDEKILMPLRSRISTRHNTKRICYLMPCLGPDDL